MRSTQLWLSDYEEYVEMIADEGFTYAELPSFLETPGSVKSADSVN